MRIITILFIVFFVFSYTHGQEIVSATHVGSITKEEIGDSVGMQIFSYGADYYKITYESKDAKGVLDTLSALLMVPSSHTDNIYPLLFYEHGTSTCKECVPSRFPGPGGEEGVAALVFAGMGYVSLLPDYVGMGDGRGFQTYVHNETSFSASEDLLIAFRAWAPNNNIQLNDQLFITGYSQGGYAAMSFHKGMQEKYGAASVTAAAHNSGPYSLSGVMRDLILIDSSYAYPAYIPNTMLGMNEVYEMYPDISEFFKPTFVPDIQAYYDGNITLSSLNNRIIDTLVANFGDTIAHRMIQDDILTEIETNPNHIVNQILEENDVHKWVPQSPTRMFYCMADDQVPFMNSVVALDTMLARGADPELVQISDVNSTYNHTECVEPAFLSTVIFFGPLQDVTLGVESQTKLNVKIYPNPVNDFLHIEALNQEVSNIKIWDLNGRLKTDISNDNISGGVDVSNLESGMYIIQLTGKNEAVLHQKFTVKR